MSCLTRALTGNDILRGLQVFRSDVLRNGSKPVSTVRIGTKISSNYSSRLTLIGLCISGGPDSMALASLMTAVDPEQLGFGIDPTALIINHNARAGSVEEASSVREELEKMGIPTQIRSIRWPTNTPPLELSNFEHLAREYRYRALADVASELRIKHLFLGHHQDDQIETILMRLARNKKPSFLALQGMVEASAIPCCESIRHAQSDEPSMNSSHPLKFGGSHRELEMDPQDSPTPSSDPKFPPFQNEIKMLAPGGMRIYRPLLAYTKASLIATCHANGISYVTDKSNDDITLTARNTVRYIRKNYTLPRALQKNSILRLCEASQASLHNIREKSMRLLQSIRISRLDLRSGTIVAQLPSGFHQTLQQDRNASANLIFRLTRIVSPKNTDEISSLVSDEIVQDFARHSLEMSQNYTATALEKSFACNMVSITLSQGSSRLPEQLATLQLSRQPMRKREIEEATMTFELTPDSSQANFYRSKWLFWDKRYWIRLDASHSSILSVIQITPFQANDTVFQQNENNTQTATIQKLLHIAAPGKLRYTLPVLKIKNDIIAFPTLHHETIGDKAFRSVVTALGIDNPWLRWNVEYKAIEDLSPQEKHPDTSKFECTAGGESKLLATSGVMA